MDPHYVLYYYYGVVGCYMYYLVLGRTNGPSLCAILLLWCGGVLHVLSCVRTDKWTLAMCYYIITMAGWCSLVSTTTYKPCCSSQWYVHMYFHWGNISCSLIKLFIRIFVLCYCCNSLLLLFFAVATPYLIKPGAD